MLAQSCYTAIGNHERPSSRSYARQDGLGDIPTTRNSTTLPQTLTYQTQTLLTQPPLKAQVIKDLTVSIRVARAEAVPQAWISQLEKRLRIAKLPADRPQHKVLSYEQANV